MGVLTYPRVVNAGRDLCIGEYTWAGLLAVPNPQAGWTAQVTDLGNNGRSMWIYSATRSRWIPVGGSYIHYKKWGSVSNPLASHTGVTATTFFTIPGGNPTLPANLLSADSEVYIRALYKKSGANGACVPLANLSTTDNATDAQLFNTTMGASDNAGFRMGVFAAFRSSTVFVTPFNSLENQANTSHAERTSGVNTAATMYISFATTASNASDTQILVGADVEVRP